MDIRVVFIALVGICKREQILDGKILPFRIESDRHAGVFRHLKLFPGGRAVVSGDDHVRISGISAGEHFADRRIIPGIVRNIGILFAIVKDNIDTVAEGKAERVELINRPIDIDVAEFFVVDHADLPGGHRTVFCRASGKQREKQQDGKQKRCFFDDIQFTFSSFLFGFAALVR